MRSRRKMLVLSFLQTTPPHSLSSDFQLDEFLCGFSDRLHLLLPRNGLVLHCNLQVWSLLLEIFLRPSFTFHLFAIWSLHQYGWDFPVGLSGDSFANQGKRRRRCNAGFQRLSSSLELGHIRSSSCGGGCSVSLYHRQWN